jgi:hypothetical protein
MELFIAGIMILLFIVVSFFVILLIQGDIYFAAWAPVFCMLGNFELWWWALAWTLVCFVVALKVEVK